MAAPDPTTTKPKQMLNGWSALRWQLNWYLPISLRTISAITKSNLRSK